MKTTTRTEETIQLIEESRAARKELQRDLIALQNRLNALEDLFDEVDKGLDRLEDLMQQNIPDSGSTGLQQTTAGGVTA